MKKIKIGIATSVLLSVVAASASSSFADNASGGAIYTANVAVGSNKYISVSGDKESDNHLFNIKYEQIKDKEIRKIGLTYANPNIAYNQMIEKDFGVTILPTFSIIHDKVDIDGVEGTAVSCTAQPGCVNGSMIINQGTSIKKDKTRAYVGFDFTAINQKVKADVNFKIANSENYETEFVATGLQTLPYTKTTSFFVKYIKVEDKSYQTVGIKVSF